MTRDEAVQLARDVVRLNGEQSPGEGHVATDLARALLAAHEEMERMAKVVEAFVDSVERAVCANEQRGRGGQHVPFHGDFASAPPSVLIQLERYAREIKAALAASGEESP